VARSGLRGGGVKSNLSGQPELSREGYLMKYCQTCGKGLDEDQLLCPNGCRGEFGPAPPERRLTQSEIAAMSSEVWRRTWKRHVFLIAGELSLLAIIGALGLKSAYNAGVDEVKGMVVSKVSREFEATNIQATVRQAAEDHAPKYFANAVQPSITTFKGDLSRELVAFKQSSEDQLKAVKESTSLVISNEMTLLKTNIAVELAAVRATSVVASASIVDLEQQFDLSLYRTIGPADKRLFVDYLKNAPKIPVTIGYLETGNVREVRETKTFANEVILRLLQEAGYPSTVRHFKHRPVWKPELIIPILVARGSPHSEGARKLAEGFRQLGRVSGVPDADQDFAPEMRTNEVVVFIGTRAEWRWTDRFY
jgi:hypothetical protein